VTRPRAPAGKEAPNHESCSPPLVTGGAPCPPTVFIFSPGQGPPPLRPGGFVAMPAKPRTRPAPLTFWHGQLRRTRCSAPVGPSSPRTLVNEPDQWNSQGVVPEKFSEACSKPSAHGPRRSHLAARLTWAPRTAGPHVHCDLVMGVPPRLANAPPRQPPRHGLGEGRFPRRAAPGGLPFVIHRGIAPENGPPWAGPMSPGRFGPAANLTGWGWRIRVSLSRPPARLVTGQRPSSRAGRSAPLAGAGASWAPPHILPDQGPPPVLLGVETGRSG